MNRRDTLLALVALGAVPLAARAQPIAKPARIAYLHFSSPEASGYLLDAFKQGLLDLGYIEGKNIVFEVRWAMGQAGRLPDLAKELVALKPDAIAALSLSTARAAQNATTTIPIVIASISDPIGLGFVKSLAHPGGNITGLSTMAHDYIPKLLELVQTVVPKRSRIAILVGFDANRAMIKNLQTAAEASGASLLAIDANTAAEIEPGFARMARESVKAVIVLPSSLFTLHRRQTAEFAAKYRIPSVFTSREFTEAGGFMSYGADYADQNRQAATYVDRILKGAKPEDLPIEQPTTLNLAINLRTAKALGITMPKELLLRADKVIE